MRSPGGPRARAVLAVILAVFTAPPTLECTAEVAGVSEAEHGPNPGYGPSVAVPPVELRLIEEGRRLPIDLPAVIGMATASNLDILVAKTRHAEAKAAWEEALGRLLPVVGGSFTAESIDGRIQASFGGLGRRAFSTLVPAVRVDLGFNPGQVIFDALAAHSTREAAEVDREAVTQRVLAAGVKQYFDLLEAQARVRIEEQSLAAARELARLARDREQEGVGLKVDVLRGEARVAAEEILLAQARKTFRVLSVRLALTLRVDPTVTLFPMDTEVRQVRLVETERSVDSLIASALAARPDVDAQALRVAAARRGRRARWADAVGPTVYGSFEESAIGRSAGNLRDRQIYGGFLGLRLSPASIGDVRASQARLERARLESERVRQRVAAEVIGAREDALTAAEQVGAALRGVRAAEASLALSQVRFERGVGIVLEVLEAQAAASKARTALVASIVGYNTAQVGLLRALGGISEEAILGGLKTTAKDADSPE